MVAIAVIFWCLWTLLLIDCVRRRRFAPLLRTRGRTKLLWLATFVLFDVWALLLYALAAPPWRATSVRRPRRAILVIGALVVIVPLAPLPFAGPGSAAAVVERTPAGRLVRSGGASPWPRMGYAVLTSPRIQVDLASVVRGSQGKRLDCRRIAIVAREGHPILIHLGRILQERLIRLDFVRRVDLAGPGERIVSGDIRFPDWVLELALEDDLTLRGPLVSHCRGVVRVSSLGTLRNSVVFADLAVLPSDRSPLEFSWGARVRYSGTVIGHETAARRLYTVAEAIAAEIDPEAFLRRLQSLHGCLGDAPEAVLGRWRPASVRDALTSAGAVESFSGRGLLLHHVSLWDYAPPEPVDVGLERLRGRLEARGWTTVGRGAPDRTDRTALWMARGERGEGVLLVRPWTSPGGGAGATRYRIHCAEGFGPAEFDRAIAEALRPPVCLGVIAQFSEALRDERQDRALELLDAAGSMAPEVHLLRARIRRRRGEVSQARSALRAAHLLGRLQWNLVIDDSIRALARELDAEAMLELPPDIELCRSLGFVDVDDDRSPRRLEVSVNEPIVLLARTRRGGPGDPGGVRLACGIVRSGPGGRPTDRWEFEFTRLSGDSGSAYARSAGEIDSEGRWSSGGTLVASGRVATLSVLSVGDGRFRASIDVREKTY